MKITKRKKCTMSAENATRNIYTGGDKNLRSKANCGAILQQLQNRAVVECSMEVGDHCCQREKSAHM
jgi:hypothetical protein